MCVALTGPSTWTPKVVPQLRRAVLRSPVTSDVRLHEMHSPSIIALLFLPMVLGSCTATDCSSPETELRSSFEAKLPTLETLRLMSDEDRAVIRIAPTFTRLETDWSWPRPSEKLGFTEARWNEYRRLFAEVGASEGLDRSEASVLLTTKACGLGISGKSFGYAFLSKKPQSMLSKLDELRVQGIGYIPIRGNWYVFVWAS